MTQKQAGFTLIELLVVVAVIAILAAIAVPNFLEAQTRSKVSRTYADMAVISAGLKSYAADHNQYPPHQEAVKEFLLKCQDLETVTDTNTSMPATAEPASAQSSGIYGYQGVSEPDALHRTAATLAGGRDLWQLTTPIAYCGRSLPPDTWQYGRDLGFGYVSLADFGTSTTAVALKAARYALISEGPDRRGDFVNPLKGPWMHYDPTNGTVSRGDLLRFGNNSLEIPGSLAPPVSPDSYNGDHRPI
jgi:prepilin-type N-terminal cleavage/methylation domain-containing protein